MESRYSGKNIVINGNVVIGENVIIEDNVYIDYNTIVKDNVTIKAGTFVGANCILGEFLANEVMSRKRLENFLTIGRNSIIRSGSIIYSDNEIGDNFQTGHNVTIREHCEIGCNVSVGTLSDIQGHCHIGDFVRAHSNVHIGQKSFIDDYVMIFPYVVLTNDPTPPSDDLIGVRIESFAIVSTGSVVLPGVHIASDALVAASANVTKDVKEYEVVGGNPAKVIGDVRKIKNRFTNEIVYPWRYHFKRGMPWESSDYEQWLVEIGRKTNE